MAVFPDEDRELYPEMFKLPVGCYEAPLSMSKEQSCAASGRPAAAERLEKVAHEAAPSLGQRAGRAASMAAGDTAVLLAT